MGALGDVQSLEAFCGDSLTINHYHVVDPADRPKLPHNGYDENSESIPCFDLAALRSSPERELLLGELLRAAQSWGFFQVTGHCVEQQVIDDMEELGFSVFKMPLKEKLKAVPSEVSPSGYLCGVVNKEQKSWLESLHSWADPEDFTIAADKLWSSPDEAQKFKGIHHSYSLAMEKLGMELLELLEEALGVKGSGFTGKWELSKRTFVRFNFYPPCEQPENILGAVAHTDPSLITILHQDQIGGLQILKDGEWVACKPKPGAFVVNIGDCLQVLSNDVLPSVQHRVCVNRSESRLSIATFAFPNEKALIEPCPELVDENHGAQFKSFHYEDFANYLKTNGYRGKKCLSHFKL